MFLDRIWGVFSHDLAIDLGTTNTLVYVRGRGIVLNEPSVVAVKTDEKGNQRIMAVGKEARMMLGRTPEDITAIQPIKDGVMSDFEITEAMLRHFITKVHSRRALVRPRVIVAVPTGITQVEKSAVRESAHSAGARDVYFIEEPVAAAIGADLPVMEPTANMVVDIGGGTTEVVVISIGGIVYSKSVRVGGHKMDEAIVQYIKKRHNLLIGQMTAEDIKINVGSAFPGEKDEAVEVNGRDLASGIPKILTIGSQEISEAISEQVNTIVETVRNVLEQMPPELVPDIVDKGIVMTGGGSLLKNLDLLLRKETNLPITTTDDPLSTVVLGCGKALANLSALKEIMMD